MKSQTPDFKKLVQRAFDSHDISAYMHVSVLAQQLKDNPKQGINLIYQTFEDALKQAYTQDGVNHRAFVESQAGGPMETTPWAVYNSVGDVYPYFEREQRFSALRQILRCLDKYNTRYVQDTHTPGIREPLLLTDICIVRPVYWPGLDEGQSKIKRYKSFMKLKEGLIDEKGMFRRDKVQSDFIMAWSLLCSLWSPWSEDYAKVANPDFLERTLKGLVNYCFHNCVTAESIGEEFENFKLHLPKSVHHRIQPLIDEKDWPDYKEFR